MSEMYTDLAGYIGVNQASEAVVKHSTNKKAGSGLVMDDFLQLMVAMFQNQSIDDVASTSDMMNQMVQMSVIQAISNINDLYSQGTNLTYAASLVGKQVTIGVQNGTALSTVQGTVTGTGTLNGEQVIFLGDRQYNLSDVIAVGSIPNANAAVKNTTPAQTTAPAQNTTPAQSGAVEPAEEPDETQAEDAGEAAEETEIVPTETDETDAETDIPAEAYEEAAEETDD